MLGTSISGYRVGRRYCISGYRVGRNDTTFQFVTSRAGQVLTPEASYV